MTQDQKLTKLVAKVYAKLASSDPEKMSSKPGPDKWSKKEILGHLVDSYQNNVRRIVLSYHQDHLYFDGYDPDLWVKANGYQRMAWIDLVELWKNSHDQMVILIAEVPVDILERMTSHHHFDTMLMNKTKKGEASNLRFLIEDYIDHQEYHLNQILV